MQKRLRERGGETGLHEDTDASKGSFWGEQAGQAGEEGSTGELEEGGEALAQ